MDKSYRFKVIIVGGGVVGLTLANALEQAGIDYLLLERRDEVDPRYGQSIAAEPNGSRILDQLGILEKWRQHAQAGLWWYERDTNGEILSQTDGLQLGGIARTGYSFDFGDRGDYLETIYSNIKDKSKVLASKCIISLEPSETSVTVKCEDGSSYTGDMVVGADGVRSKVREEMWRLASPTLPALVEQDRNALFAEYRCLFGIATSPPGPIPGDCDFGYDRDRSSLVFAGPNGKSYYFVFEKLDKLYRGSNIPRYTKDDAVKYAEKHATFVIRPGLTIADFWEKSNNQNLAALEEGKFKLWTWGRIACVGDSVAKMTPNIGFGGNCGIESAAALANAIHSIVKAANGQRPSDSQVEENLRAYQKKRQKRANGAVQSAGEVTRMQAGKTLYHRSSAKLVRLFPGDFIANFLSEYFSDAELLSYLPPPKSSVGRLQPFNPNQGESQRESTLRRALLALPFLVSFYFVKSAMDPAPVVPFLAPILERGAVTWENGSALIRSEFYGVKQIDNLWVPINIFFTPIIYGYDPIARTQVRMLLVDYGVIIAIWAFESVRRANIFTFARIPTLFTLLGQLCGIGMISPIYYFLYYTFTPVEKFKASDMRLGRRNFALALLPVMALAYYGPLFAMMEWSTNSVRESWLFIWQMCPIWIMLGTSFFSFVIPDSTLTDRFNAPNRDLPIIRYTIGTLIGISSTIWIWTFMTSDYGLLALFTPERLPAHTADFVAFTREFLRLDEISLFGHTFIWLGYLFWDLKHAGMLRTSWVKVLLYFGATIAVFGPGATAGLGWLWRENVLASSRHKDAVVAIDTGKQGSHHSNGSLEKTSLK